MNNCLLNYPHPTYPTLNSVSTNTDSFGTTSIYTFGDYVTTITNTKNHSCPEKAAEKETAMSLEQNQIDYLLRRIDNVYYELWKSLPEKFNLHRDNTPKNYKELIDAIKNDKFKLDGKRIKHFINEEEDEDEFDGISPCGPFDGIIWDGPQPDHKGYDAARKSLGDAKTRALDIVKTSPAADGLKALQEFQKWTPEGTSAN